MVNNDDYEGKWKRPEGSFHAHFDCFSGAAGDMMLAACLDAANDPNLVKHIQYCLTHGMPSLKGEFSLSVNRVWRSETGCIAANYVSVKSKYGHKPVPVPKPTKGKVGNTNEQGNVHTHEHSHTDAHEHVHDHSGTTTSETILHADTEQTSSNVSSHSHNHAHNTQTGPSRNLPQIRTMVNNASSDFISDWVKENAIAAFTELAKAEAYVHGAESLDAVHFHEVGAIDSIVDTVGTLVALDCLNVKTVSCSRLPLGEGTVWTQHGLLPVPAPATLRLLVDMPTCPGPPGVTGELVTPTAASLLKVLTRKGKSKIPGRAPCFTIRKIGVGAGTKDFARHPNILRVMIGDDLVKTSTKGS